MQIELTSVQAVVVTVDAVNDADDASVAITGDPVWTSSDPVGLELVPAGGGLSATLSATQKLGDYKVTVSAVAAVGAGGANQVLVGEFKVKVIAAQGRRLQFSPAIPAPRSP